MEKEDGRKLSRQAQFERRKQAVRLHKRGMAIHDIAATLGMGHVSVRGRSRPLRPAASKRWHPSPPVARWAVAVRSVLSKICKSRPEQLKLEFALWSRASVLALVKQEFGIELPVRTMGEYLRRWGFTPQKPIVRT